MSGAGRGRAGGGGRTRRLLLSGEYAEAAGRGAVLSRHGMYPTQIVAPFVRHATAVVRIGGEWSRGLPILTPVFPNRHDMGKRLQFSLRQMFLAITLVATCLGVVKWCHVKYFDRVFAVPTDRGLDRPGLLYLYLGKRVSVCGRYQYIGANSAYQVLWFGEQAIAIVGISPEDPLASPSRNGSSLRVIGRLTRSSTRMSPVVPLPRRDWPEELRYHPGAKVVQSIAYSISVEDTFEEDRGDKPENAEEYPNVREGDSWNI